MRRLIPLLFCILSVNHAFSEPELKGTATELAQYLTAVPRTVTVSGDGDVHVPADRVVVSLKVTTENRSLQEALRANQDVRGKLLGSLKKQGIAAERVQASKFSSTPKFGLFGEKAKSYRVENVVKVTVLDEKEFQGAAGAVDGWSEVQFVGAEFEHVDKEALKAKAIEQACDKANARKRIYEEKLGVKLVPAAFVEGRVAQNVPPRALRFEANSPAAKSHTTGITRLPAVADSAEVEESTSSFGELVYTAQVTVEYTVQAR